ncbi:4a-hydroxytetrahydrobiopterin dehydratase [Neomicrococcus aestuarii]|uniref:Putative pterin-4-alpha-carbinolamine dehydratase n=1 Tax=Neomicrococcus aestuarii TaxID=556325 RepID=A0A1L2ZKX0_9MICC|nr:4a-hydroxytetrahydrobiopterin dehydratase [Neomicrococcus aestuarii]APF39668.1 hypothetical protein BHE16_00025 [Neomicrococcus aestuarii]
MSESEDQPKVLSTSAIITVLETLTDWREDASRLVAVFKFKRSATAVEFIARVGAAAEDANHHPDLEWRWNTVFLALSTHSKGSQITTLDAQLAEKLSATAAELGGTAEPARYGEQFGI